MTETEQRPQAAVVPVSAGHLAAAGLIAERAQDALAQLQAENEHLKSALERVRALAQSWAALAPADDWGESMAGTAAADCGRLILSVTDTAVAGAGGAEAELAGMRERVLAGAEARKTTLTWPYDDGTTGELDVVPLSALRKLLGMPVESEPCGEHGESTGRTS